ncbi:hypothetical protein SPRG_08152 [Saprolegnia parasitica CBS 223.65]|uniref:Uncharacterized protein n=1 Tax=Saprolegnia parasitica (strain CBS 223.65) TaxID=695850 RepID=A0A067C8N4_SAPPC|nr:hypothetical protein SPRG_08152 [Saprolegnia parasitica CBS 223.65]KDO26863.1 hypothetical protein SPRG_08152 [Saprolegnia parasitica CBS 223.65]|eukprot:XP_012202506.1 hypothetical protein SPRG_08152 [Saprolegnia parasitica CBS 223.65]
MTSGLAEAVVKACAAPINHFESFYPLEASIDEKARAVYQKIYGADDVIFAVKSVVGLDGCHL